MKHNVGRFSGPVSGHSGSLLYYFPVLLFITLPFTALLLPVALRLRDIWRDELQAYLLIWFAFVFVFFSLSGTKLPHYVLYGYTGLAVLMALRAYEPRAVAWTLAPVLAFFVALLLLPHAVTYVVPRIADAYYREALGAALPHFEMFYFAFFGIVTGLAVYGMLERRTALPRKLAIFGVMGVIGLSTLVVPFAGRVQAPIKEAALLCRERNIEPVMWRLNAPSFSVYRGAPTVSRDPRPGDVVLTKASHLTELPKGSTYELIYSRGGIVLARITA